MLFFNNYHVYINIVHYTIDYGNTVESHVFFRTPEKELGLKKWPTDMDHISGPLFLAQFFL